MKRTILVFSLSLALGAQDSVVGPSPRPGAVVDAASSVASPGAGAAARPSRSCITRHRYDERGFAWLWEECFDYDWVGARPRVVIASPMPALQDAGWWKRHLADTAAHATGTALDAASSWGQREANPILRSADGRFGVQGAVTKGLIFAGSEFAKWKLARRYPRSKLVRAISLVPAAAFGGVAARNWRVR